VRASRARGSSTARDGLTDRLTPRTREELTALAARYGEPLRVRERIRARFVDPIGRLDRFGEVCMVIRRPAGTLLLLTKEVYPAGVFRLPTGGISHGESVLDALRREAHEETGLAVEVHRFLAWIDYLPPDRDDALFHTFAFLLRETGGTLGALDPDELVLGFREVTASGLSAVAERLAAIPASYGDAIGGDWSDWGEFRAVVHRAVAEALGG
jgi:ADP-ribose pyrophosphatase YjhB (NUDIX family)